jgi:hypothetical protein
LKFASLPCQMKVEKSVNLTIYYGKLETSFNFVFVFVS